jgi:very-short-patch-repair endonuclease
MGRPKIRAPERTTVRGRELRQESTYPERVLWGRLRDRRCAGLKFRRQQPLGEYVVDHYCESAKVVIELDGFSHAGRTEGDRHREEILEGLGVRVIRFTNEDVLKDLEGVVMEIARVCTAGE